MLLFPFQSFFEIFLKFVNGNERKSKIFSIFEILRNI
jgi:hypothetical protein